MTLQEALAELLRLDVSDDGITRADVERLGSGPIDVSVAI
jgi:hypothetical protein